LAKYAPHPVVFAAHVAQHAVMFVQWMMAYGFDPAPNAEAPFAAAAHVRSGGGGGAAAAAADDAAAASRDATCQSSTIVCRAQRV
jgi:hypothetical protein